MGWLSIALLLTPPTQVLPHSGRVELLGDDGHVHLLAPGELATDTGPAWLVLGARSTAEVVWPGRGSLRLTGPCAVEWTVPANATSDDGIVSVRFGALGGAEVEWRVGELALELPGGWRVAAGRSAFGVAWEGAGARVDARAGAPLGIEAPRGAAWLWPRRDLRPGDRLRLAARPPERQAVDRSASAPPWPRVEWPWGESVIAPRVSLVEPPRSR